MTKIEAVIFDWAGTTIDYGCFAPVQAFIEAFKEFNITPTIQEVRKPMGMLKWDHIHTMMQMPRISKQWENIYQRKWTKEDVDNIYKTSEQAIFKILKDFSTPKPYVLETIEKLREKEIKIGSTTGYTDEMMSYVLPSAKKQGYSPDVWFSPNSVNNIGRPYPFMIFKNLEALKVSSVNNAIKVGDTIADIKEGKNAGLISIGIIEGSSIMGLTEKEYNSLTKDQKTNKINHVKKVYEDSGADYIIMNMSNLIDTIKKIQN